jgi:alpha-galactosidase
VPQLAIPNKKPKNYRTPPAISGGCTWYTFGPHITPSKILKYAESVQGQHSEINYILVDDGWCTWGDWQQPQFNIADISQKLSQKKLKTGLWLAPFLVSPRSKLSKQHPEYLLKNQEGMLISNLDKYLPFQKAVLDITNPDVVKYIYDSIDMVITQWGIQLLKLDFLYAAYFNSAFKDDIIPHQILVDLFTYIKTKYPHVYLMACGCPFAPAKYLVDSIRISDDITVPWLYPYGWLKRLVHTRQLNLLQKKWYSCQSLSKYFNLDPDVLPDQLLAGFTDKQMEQVTKIFKESRIKFYG